MKISHISHSIYSHICGYCHRLVSSEIRKKRHFTVSIILHILILGVFISIPGCPKKITIVESITNVKLISSLDPGIKKEPVSQTPKPPELEKPSTISLPEPKPKPKPKPKTEAKPKKLEKYSSEDFKKRLENKLKSTEEPRPPQPGTQEGLTTGIRTNIKENWYLALLKSKIENSWQQPSRVLMKGRGKLQMTVSFVLQKNGLANNISISESSGVTFVDLSALNAVKNSSPFPPVPESTSERSIEISIDFILDE
jgi:TonB family protein